MLTAMMRNTAGEDNKLQEERQDESQPLGVGDFGQGEHGHQHAGGRNDGVGQPVAELEGEHGRLPGDAQHVRDRGHERHGDRSLPGTRRDNEVERALEEEHADHRDVARHALEYDGRRVDYGIENLGVQEDDLDPASEAGQPVRRPPYLPCPW